MKSKPESVQIGARTCLFPSNVTHLEAEINYTKVYYKTGKNQLLSSTIKDVAAFLQSHGNFIRISRKHVINLDYVKQTKEDSFLLQNGLRLGVSRRKKKELKIMFD